MAEHTRDNSVGISGGQVVAGNIGGSGNAGRIHGPVNLSGSTDAAAMTTALEQLRAELARLRAQLAVTEGSDAEPGDIDDVIDAVTGPEPDIERATSRWTRLVRRIPESLRSLDSVSRIVALLEQIQALRA